MRRPLLAGCAALALLLALGIWVLLRLGSPQRGSEAAPQPVLLLARAARAGDAARVRDLVAGGADPNSATAPNGWTPLLHAVHTGSRDGVRALLGSGADPDAPGARGQRPLLMAASRGDAEVVGLLLDAGADPSLGGQGWGNALEAALTGNLDLEGPTFTRCQPGTVRVILERHPELGTRGPMGRLGRFFAYARGCEEVERLLEAPPAARVLAAPE